MQSKIKYSESPNDPPQLKFIRSIVLKIEQSTFLKIIGINFEKIVFNIAKSRYEFTKNRIDFIENNLNIKDMTNDDEEEEEKL
jgi:hypothetical protein